MGQDGGNRRQLRRVHVLRAWRNLTVARESMCVLKFAFLAALAVLIAVPLTAAVLHVPMASARDDDDAARMREEREQRQREQQEQRRQREQDKAARNAERAQAQAERAARDQQRALERQQREQDKAARDAERVKAQAERAARDEQRAEEQRQRAAQREQAQSERETARETARETVRESSQESRAEVQQQQKEQRAAARDEVRDSRSADSTSRNGTSPQTGNSPGSAAANGSRASDGSRSSNRQSEGQNGKSDDKPSGGQNKSTGNSTQSSNSDDDDGDESKNKAANKAKVIEEIVEPEEEVEPPKTIAEWWQRVTGDETKNKKENATTAAGQSDQENSVSAASGSDGKAATAKAPEAKAATSPAKSNETKKSAAAVPGKASGTSAPAKAALATIKRRGSPDFGLLAQGNFVPRQIVAGGLDATGAARVEALGFSTTTELDSPGLDGHVRRLTVPRGMSEQAALKLLESNVPEALFGPNHVYRIVPAGEAPDTSHPAARSDGNAPQNGACGAEKCFAHQLIGWRKSLSRCASKVRIGLIDTSFDTSHPDFAGLKYKSESFAASAKPSKSDWHGTAVLSILAGKADGETPGLVPEAEYLLASTFGTGKDGTAAADAVSVLKALSWLDRSGAGVVNMSFSGPSNDLIELAIAAMAAKGVIFIAAAGNGGQDAPASYPAAYPQVVAVTAVSKEKRQYRYANRGGYVDVAAPGVDIWTALPGSAHGYRTGTSFATPVITGLLAALPAVRDGAGSKQTLLSRISFEDLGEAGRDAIYGEGLPKAPERCTDIGGVASLPWLSESSSASAEAAETESRAFTPASMNPAAVVPTAVTLPSSHSFVP